MVTHVVLFKLKDGAPASLEATQAVLSTMPEHIPQLRYFEVGGDARREGRSYDVGLITRFDSWEDLDAYRHHPYHLDVINAHLGAVVESAVFTDWETL